MFKLQVDIFDGVSQALHWCRSFRFSFHL